MSKLVLYRGDSSNISRFKLKETFKHCLFGQGIYLTDSFKVADSYRSKGADHDVFARSQTWLLRGEVFPSVGEAWKQAYLAWVNFKLEKAGIRVAGSDRETSKAWQRALSQYRSEWEDLLLERDRYFDVTVMRNVPVGYQTRRSDPKLREACRVTIIYFPFGNQQRVGRITKFEFAESDFLPRIINVEWRMGVSYAYLTGFQQELVKACALHANVDAYDLYQVVSKAEVGLSVNNFFLEFLRLYKNKLPSKYRHDRWLMLRDHFQHNYLGLEYPGGTVVGGKGFHRAFVIWDEDYVNQHRVSTIR